MGTGNTKICTKCGEIKLLTNEFFQWRTDRDSWRTTCKSCIKTQKQAYNKSNIEKQQKDKKRYYLINQERIKNKRKSYYNDNKARVFKCNKLWDAANNEKMIAYHRQYYLDNKEYLLKQVYVRKKERYTKDPSYKFRSNISRMILLALKKSNSSKRGESITKYLSYSIDELKKHIESQWETWMDWNNYGKYKLDSWDDNDVSTWKWNIDHIIPRSILAYDSMTHVNFCKCWSLDNLRPMSAKENLYKGSKRI